MPNSYIDESIMKLSGEPIEYAMRDYVPDTAMFRFVPDPKLIVEEITMAEWLAAHPVK